jgi:hypothetical protein
MNAVEIVERLREKYKNGEKMVLRTCSLCEYPCGYLWYGPSLFYDTGCDCTRMRGGPQPRDESDLIDCIQTHPEWAAEMLGEISPKKSES